MNGNEFLDRMEWIDPAYVEAADMPPRIQKRSRIRPWFVAACLCVLAGAMTALAVGGFLHDFYLYDWHKTSSFHGLRRLFEMHGFSHPGSACVNAKRYFQITKKEQNIIQSHMWPLTFRHVPTCREAVIVCLADKYCAVVESMFRRAKAAATVGADETDETLW
mgnify:CR=1 FL=1